MPNLVQILSIFLQLQAVKQSGPGFLAYPVGNIRNQYRQYKAAMKEPTHCRLRGGPIDAVCAVGK